MKKLLFRQRQFLLYCVIGSSGVTLDFGVYWLLLHSGRLHYQAANATGYAGGTLLSFVLNARFNFRVTDQIGLRLASFIGVAFMGWLASASLLQVLIGEYDLNKYAAKFAALVLVVVLQYNLNRLISFRKAS